MKKRVFNRKKPKVGKYLLPYIGTGIVGSIVLTVLIKGLFFSAGPASMKKYHGVLLP